MKRTVRSRQPTPEDAAQNKGIRLPVAEEFGAPTAHSQEPIATLDQLEELIAHLKAAREAKGLSLSDLEERTGMDRSAVSKLETGQRANPTVETLVRYAGAVGKRLLVSLEDA
jgi:ribosome-binding protein aMBF1 (putative translation factor)